MNDNYFLAISLRCKDKAGKRRYFLGLVQCFDKDSVHFKGHRYDLKIIEKKELQFEVSYSRATLKKYCVLAVPTKGILKDFNAALREFFKGQNAIAAWAYQKIESLYPDVDCDSIDYFNIITGVAK